MASGHPIVTPRQRPGRIRLAAQFMGNQKPWVVIASHSCQRQHVVTGCVALFPGGLAVWRWGRYFPLLLTAALSACLEPQHVDSYATLSINPGSATIVVGETKNLTATMRNLQGQVLTGPVTWWS